MRNKFPNKENEEESIAKKYRVRSPGYPMIGLEEAIEKVKILWNKDKTNPIPREVAAKHLGYGASGGYPGRVIAALKHFDLISMSEGDIILSDKAVELAHYSPSDEIYQNIVREIALKPNSYRELFDEYNGSLPSDATLKVKLIKDYKFNAEKVGRFISNFRSTIAFAGLTEIRETKEEEDVEVKRDSHSRLDVTLPTFKTGRDMVTTERIQSFPIPLSRGKKAAINFESLPVEKKDIEAIKKWLELFSDSLTETEGNEN